MNAETETESKPISEKVKESMKSEDEPLGEQVPGAPFAIVGLMYPLILCLVLAVIAFYFYFLR